MFVSLGYMYYNTLSRIHCPRMDTKAVKAIYQLMALKLYICIEPVC